LAARGVELGVKWVMKDGRVVVDRVQRYSGAIR
jgi:hypothetical protein